MSLNILNLDNFSVLELCQSLTGSNILCIASCMFFDLISFLLGVIIHDLKHKYQQQADQLNEDLDNVKKVTLVVGLMIGILSHIVVYNLKKKYINFVENFL